ncbi:hypothetical protein [Hymenobacter crusticola]|uniref:Uncharacterized protein n=1 Tax=Hymenobacter crusticola TaxID=1770526 RepID=A0A243WGB1_9BACT|nr:hypothetical protein [Hymenobacter crusticola]OUJ74791.1 hypothetical protein BXP70_08525 [Hymenobacter crusticola]
MKKPVTRVLFKIIANGFYRENTGLLLSLFVLIFINFFYTNVLNQTHLTPEQLIQTALKLVISTVSEPLGVVILFNLFFLYSLKSRRYVARRLKGVDVQFLFYSTNALSFKQQVQSWSIVQLVLSLPIIILGLYAVLVGLIFDYWLIPLTIPVYLLILIVANASYYTQILNNNLIETPSGVAKAGWIKGWPKPLFSLFLYEVITKKRAAYAITKLVSLVSITLIFNVFSDSRSDLRLLGIISLCIALAHIILLYQSREFELFYLRFARNFPHSQWQVYGQQVALCSLLLLPELVWFLVASEFSTGLIGACLLLSVTLLFRNLLYWLGQRMTYYLRLVFGLFIFFLLTNLFGFTALLVVGTAVAAWSLLYCYHDKY